MKKPHYIYLIITTLILTLSPISAKWNTLQSNHFTLFYPQPFYSDAAQTLYYLEKNRPNIISLTGNKKPKHIYMVFQDMGSYANGYSYTNLNKISITPNNPASIDSDLFSPNWLENVSSHELLHNIHTSYQTKRKKLLNTLFGSAGFHAALPLLLLEGLAVYQESNISNFQGRLNNGYYHAILLTKAKENKLLSLGESSYNYSHFPIGHQYIYGAGFINYLASTYSENNITKFINDTSSKSRFSAVFLDFRNKKIINKYFTKSLLANYTDFTNSLKTAASNWVLPPKNHLVLGDTLSNTVQINNYLYVLKSYKTYSAPFSYFYRNDLLKIDIKTNKKAIIKTFYTKSIKQSLVQHQDNLYISLLSYKNNFQNIDQLNYGYAVSIYQYNPTTNKFKHLIKNNITAFTFLPNNNLLYATRNPQNNTSSIINATTKTTLTTIPGHISELIYSNNSIYLSKQFDQSSFDIYHLNLNTLTLSPLIESPFNESFIQINNNFLYYSANYNHQYQLYRYHLQSKQTEKISGPSFMYKGSVNNNTLTYIGLTAAGFTLHQSPINTTPYTPPITKKFIPLSQQTQFKDFESIIKKPSLFKTNIATIAPYYRKIFLNKDSNNYYIGASITGGDKLGLVNYYIAASKINSSINLSSTLLKPFECSYSNYDGDEYLYLSKTIFNNPLSLLKYTQIGLTYDLNNFYPTIYQIYKKRNLKTAININLPITSSAPFYYTITNTLLFNQSQLNYMHYYTQNTSHYKILHGIIIEDINEENIHTLSIEYTKKITDFIHGSWETNASFGHSFASIFYDYSTITVPYTAYGLSTQFEMSFLNNVNLIYEFSYIINLETLTFSIGI